MNVLVGSGALGAADGVLEQGKLGEVVAGIAVEGGEDGVGEEVAGSGIGGAEEGGEGVEVVAEERGTMGPEGLEVGMGEAVPARVGGEDALPAFGAGGDGAVFGVDGALIAEVPALVFAGGAVVNDFRVDGELELPAEIGNGGGGRLDEGFVVQDGGMGSGAGDGASEEFGGGKEVVHEVATEGVLVAEVGFVDPGFEDGGEDGEWVADEEDEAGGGEDAAELIDDEVVTGCFVEE